MPRNTLVIADTHIPFELKGYLEFCVEIERKFKCNHVVHIGDLVDNNAISYHDHDPDGWSPADEMKEADKHLTEWFKAFPEVKLCRGNHDSLVDRKSKTVGLPSRCFKDFRDVWSLPSGWEDAFDHTIDGVLYKHGTGLSGKLAHVQLAINERCSSVMGHTHSSAGVEWIANSKECIFGMNVGCGIDRKKYAFSYGRDFKYKPIIGCGVVLEDGKYAQFIPMSL